jgi:hypothetical protein
LTSPSGVSEVLDVTERRKDRVSHVSDEPFLTQPSGVRGCLDVAERRKVQGRHFSVESFLTSPSGVRGFPVAVISSYPLKKLSWPADAGASGWILDIELQRGTQSDKRQALHLGVWMGSSWH